MRRLKNAKDEGRTIIIEAIIALTVYIFTIFTILSIAYCALRRMSRIILDRTVSRVL